MEGVETPSAAAPATGEHSPTNDTPGRASLSDEFYYADSNCSTPYVSAPSSPGRSCGGGGYYYSAPASPMHYVLSSALRSSAFVPSPSEAGMSGSGSCDFEFSARFDASCCGSAAAAAGIGSMSSADELFLNGQIRPMKLSSHLQRPQAFSTCVAESDDNGDLSSGMRAWSRDFKLRDKSLRRRTRSLSPLRNTAPFDWCELAMKEGGNGEVRHCQQTKMLLEAQNNGDYKDVVGESVSNETTLSASASSSRCSSAGRSSKRWVFLKDFLRSKSEGRSNHKFWTSITFSPSKEKKCSSSRKAQSARSPETEKPGKKSGKETAKRPVNGVGKRRAVPSAHELHYTANRAQAEEMRKKTFLPYRQGLLGCLGFNSRSYGAMNGFARALKPVSSM